MPDTVRVVFLVQDLQLSGGVGVVVQHAARLRKEHGIDARIVLTRATDQPPWGYPQLPDIPVLEFEDAIRESWDVAVATWWETALRLFELDAQRYAYFVQLLEDSTYPQEDPERLTAAMTTALPVRFITEARWIADILEDYQPGSPVLYVRNGLDKQTFRSPDGIAPATPDVPLRVVLEGARGYVQKGVDDALRSVAAMREPAHVTWVSPHAVETPPPGVDRVLSGLSHAGMAALFLESHVLLKLPRAEGMYGPPLEAFHMGATVVTTPVTGHDEYVRHAENGLVVGWDDPRGTARTLDVLARDRRRLHDLRCGALATARAWPDWQQSSQVMALALRRVLADPMPSHHAAGRRLGPDIITTMLEVENWDQRAARDVGVRMSEAPATGRFLRRAAGAARRVAHRLR